MNSRTQTHSAKNFNSQIGFITRFLNEASQEITLNESRILKFYQENSTERKFNRELCRKNLKLTLKLFDKTKKKRKRLKFKEFYFPDSHSDKLPTNCTKNLQHYIFSVPSFLFLCTTFSLKITLLSVLFFEPISELESCGTYCLNLLFDLPLMTH